MTTTQSSNNNPVVEPPKIFCLISASKGHRRQGSYNDILENLDQEVDIYIAQLSALLKLMQVHSTDFSKSRIKTAR
jgi:hypothetical protein